jgi:hypothetical protein
MAGTQRNTGAAAFALDHAGDRLKSTRRRIAHELRVGGMTMLFRGQSVGRILSCATSAASLFACSTFVNPAT